MAGQNAALSARQDDVHGLRRRQARRKPLARFKTDRAGRFDVRLPEGELCVMAGERDEVAPENSTAPSRPTGAHVTRLLRDLALACDARL